MPGIFWFIIFVLSFISAIICGRINELSAGMMSSGKQAVDLLMSFGGMICIWSGVMNVAKKSGVTSRFAKILKPFILLLFPSLKHHHEIQEDISLNMTANFLGLGNAATPAGLRAMGKLAELSGSERATKDMIKLAVINSASIQLLPTTIASVRLSAGSNTPFDILPAVWLTSICALIIGLSAVAVLDRISGEGK